MENKCLIIILGQIRAADLTWDSFEKNVFKELNADLALVIGESELNNDSNPYWFNSKYKFVSEEYENFASGYDNFQKELGCSNEWREVLSITNNQLFGGVYDNNSKPPGSAGILIYLRFFALKNILKHNLQNKYSRFIITRSDFIWLSKHPKLNYLNKNNIWVPYGEFYGGITDRYALLDSNNLLVYLNLLEPIISNHKSILSKLKKINYLNLETYIKFHLKENKKLNDLKFIPYYMYSVRKNDDPFGRWSKGAYSNKLGYNIKYNYEYFNAKIYSFFDNNSMLNRFKIYSYNLLIYRIVRLIYCISRLPNFIKKNIYFSRVD